MWQQWARDRWICLTPCRVRLDIYLVVMEGKGEGEKNREGRREKGREGERDKERERREGKGEIKTASPRGKQKRERTQAEC